LANIPPQKRRNQNRVSQRAFRLRKEKHTSDLETKVKELEALLETASYEKTVATSRMHRMEAELGAELGYYRGLLFAATSARNPNSFVTSYPDSDYRPAAGGGNRVAAPGDGGGEVQMGGYNSVSSYATHYKPVIASLVAPVLADEYQQAGSYDSSSTSSYSPAVESSLRSFSTPSEPRTLPQDQTLDNSSPASYLQFNTEEPVAVTKEHLY
jgi:hypothetical protein